MLSPAIAMVLSTALGQPAADREESSGLSFTRPDGWKQRTDEASKATFLTPPGAAAEAEIILFPMTEGGGASAQAFHDAMLAAVSAGAVVDGAATTGRTGAFQWTRTKLAPAGGGEMRVALYTSVAGAKQGAALFRATSKKAFDAHLPAAERLVKDLRFAGAPAPAPPVPATEAATIHGLRIAVPPRWTRKDDPSGLVALYPPPPLGPLEPVWDYVLVILPSQPLRGTFWETHRAVFDELVQATGIRDPVPPTWRADGPGPFIKGATAGRDATGRLRNLTLYSALSEAGIEQIVVHNQEDLEAIGALLSDVTVKSAPRTAPRVKIVEAYRRAEQKEYINREGGAPLAGSLQFERIWLRADGVADFASTYPEGYASSTTPAKLDPKLLNGDVGSWKAVGDEVHILRHAGAPAQVYRREDGKLRLGDQVWQPMPSVDGLRLDGRWGLRPAPGDGSPVAVKIELTPDGRFRDEGVLAHAGSLAVYRYPGAREVRFPRPPARGAGKYELRDFTIFITYDDGTPWSTDFSTIGSDPRDLSAILLRTFVFTKLP